MGKKKKDKVFDNESAEYVRQNLDSILDEDEHGTNNLKDLETTKDKKPKKKEENNNEDLIDFGKVRDNSYNEAKTLMDKLLKFYAKSDIITNNEYLTARKNLESQTLGSLIYQLRTAETMMTKLMEQIDRGVVEARMFEVLAETQKSLLEITRSVNVFVNNVEQNMQLNINELESQDESISDDSGNNSLESGDLKYRGTRGLMQQINNEKDNSNEENQNENDDSEDIIDELNDQFDDDSDE